MTSSTSMELFYRDMDEDARKRHRRGEELPVLDVPMLRKGVEWVQEQAELPTGDREWLQRWWRALKVTPEGETCGTAYCLAGYMGEQMGFTWVDNTSSSGPRLSRGMKRMSRYGIQGDKLEAVDVWVADQIGLTPPEASALFNELNTAENIVECARRITASRGEELGL